VGREDLDGAKKWHSIGRHKERRQKLDNRDLRNLAVVGFASLHGKQRWLTYPPAQVGAILVGLGAFSGIKLDAR
jgi:hypothetical protein